MKRAGGEKEKWVKKEGWKKEKLAKKGAKEEKTG